MTNRKVYPIILAAKITITLEACHAVDVLQEAFNRKYAEIVNADQGSQFTADVFIKSIEIKDTGSVWTGAEPGGIMLVLNDFAIH